MSSVSDIKDTLDLLGYLKKMWESKKTIVVLLLVIITFGSYILCHIDFNKVKASISFSKLLVLLLICAFVFIIWYLTRRPQKVGKGKIGIVIAISTENQKVQERLKNDFIDDLNEIIKKNHHQQFQIIVLSEYHSKKIINGKSASKYHSKTRAHLIIYGNCKIRMHETKECYYLKLDASVVHTPLPVQISNSLSVEMRAILPSKLIFRADDEIKGFILTAETLGYGARYMIGLASLVSGDLNTAYDLHNGIMEEIDRLDQEDSEEVKSGLATIRRFLPLHLSNEALILAEVVYRAKKEHYLEDMGKYLETVKRFDPRNYKAHIFRGIYYFLAKRDTKTALDEIRKSKNERDYTWQINEAFIKAYEGDLEAAHKLYKRASLVGLQSNVPLETEEFIHDMLDIEPDKIQLWYCLGMINYFIKEDLKIAKESFEHFIELSKEKNEFLKSVDFAEKYVNEIYMKLGS